MSSKGTTVMTYRLTLGVGRRARARHGCVDGWPARLRCLTVALVMGMTMAGAAVASEEAVAGEEVEKGGVWYDWFWPLGERVHVEALKDEYVPFKTGDEIPNRPPLLLELGDPFLDTGKLDDGFEVPLLGAVWQPRLWSYLIGRTTLQTFDNGAPGRLRDTEWASRIDLFANLQLTGTEKILLGLRPVDQNRFERFSRYTFDGAEEGFKNAINLDIETLFFEGDLGSLIPNLDKAGMRPIDFGFTVGRQPINFQEGILINDTVDAVGIVRNNIPFPGTSNLRISGMWSWNRLNRNDRRDADPMMFGLFAAADTPVSTFNLDTIYVHDDQDGDGFYLGVSAIQRIRALGGLSTAFRINTSFALEDEIPGNVIGNGVLITAEFSKTVEGSDDIVYLNPFFGIGNFTQAGREPILGGPLANTGILFASPNLSTYTAEINPFTNDVVGFATGYQAFWDDHRRNLILEIGGRHDFEGDDSNTLGVGFQMQQAFGRHFQLQFEAFYAYNDEQDDGSGGRVELLVVY